MSILNKLKFGLLSVCLLLYFGNSVYANEAKVTNIRLNNTRDHLLIYLDIEGAFNNKMEKAVLAGPTCDCMTAGVCPLPDTRSA